MPDERTSPRPWTRCIEAIARCALFVGFVLAIATSTAGARAADPSVGDGSAIPCRHGGITSSAGSEAASHAVERARSSLGRDVELRRPTDRAPHHECTVIEEPSEDPEDGAPCEAPTTRTSHAPPIGELADARGARPQVFACGTHGARAPPLPRG
jgi:hypothetical protein